jgi:hypothetical protein
MAWDSPLSALAEIVTACAQLDEPVIPDGVGAPHVEKVVVAMPLELQTRTSGDGGLTVAATPPRQTGETTVMPVLHRLRLTVEVKR